MKYPITLALFLAAASAFSQYGVNLTCTPGTQPTGVTPVGYNFYRSTGGAFTLLNSTPTTTCAYSDTTTASGTTYQYNVIEVATVTGVTGNVLSAPSPNTSVTIPPGPPAPGAPIILVVPIPPSTL